MTDSFSPLAGIEWIVIRRRGRRVGRRVGRFSPLAGIEWIVIRARFGAHLRGRIEPWKGFSPLAGIEWIVMVVNQPMTPKTAIERFSPLAGIEWIVIR